MAISQAWNIAFQSKQFVVPFRRVLVQVHSVYNLRHLVAAGGNTSQAAEGLGGGVPPAGHHVHAKRDCSVDLRDAEGQLHGSPRQARLQPPAGRWSGGLAGGHGSHQCHRLPGALACLCLWKTTEGAAHT